MQYPKESQKNVHWVFGFYYAIIAFDLLYVLNLWVDATIFTSRSIKFVWMCGWDVTIQHQKHKISINVWVDCTISTCIGHIKYMSTMKKKSKRKRKSMQKEQIQ
jgi:hypothetical protein